VCDRVKKIAGILHHGTIGFEFNRYRSAVHVVGVGTAIGRSFGDHRRFTVTFMIIDNRFKSRTLGNELLVEPVER